MNSESKTIGELLFQNENPLLKMWEVNINNTSRPFLKHAHTRFEISVVNSGRGEYTTENGVYQMEKGDVFVFSSNEIHCITKVYEKGISITNLHFEPRYLIDDRSISPDSNFFNICFSHSPEFLNRIPKSDAKAIAYNHNMIKSELIRNESNCETAIRAYLDLIIIDLMRNHNYNANRKFGEINTLFNITEVFNYIDTHLDEELKLEIIASVANLSPNYFSHKFKQLNGISLWEYITAKRIEKAVKMIISPENDFTMLEIAMQCGFNNTVNFNKAFKKQKGITPSELKKNPKLLSH